MIYIRAVCPRIPQYFTLKVRRVAVVYFYQRDKFDTAAAAAGENTHIYLAMRLVSGVMGIHWDTTGMANLWGTTALWHRKKLETVMVRS